MCGIVGRHAVLEGGERVGILAVERDLDDGLQAVPEQRRQPVGRQQRDLALDQPRLPQPLHSPQAGRRRHVAVRGQLLVGEHGVTLERVQQAQVYRIDVL